MPEREWLVVVVVVGKKGEEEKDGGEREERAREEVEVEVEGFDWLTKQKASERDNSPLGFLLFP